MATRRLSDHSARGSRRFRRLVAFCLVCAAQVALGVLLWRHQRIGEVLALWLLPVELVFWLGFVLPFGPVAGLARLILVLRVRRRGVARQR